MRLNSALAPTDWYVCRTLENFTTISDIAGPANHVIYTLIIENLLCKMFCDFIDIIKGSIRHRYVLKRLGVQQNTYQIYKYKYII